MYPQRERANPRMSLSKLGEYLTATMPGRRRTIIREQRKPRDFIVARYSKAEQAIKEYFTTHKPNTDQLRRAIASLSAMAHQEGWEGQTADLCTKALISFLNIAEKVPTNGFTPVEGNNAAPKLHLAGLEISVRPEVLLTDPQSGAIVGAIKLYLGKTHPLSDAAMNIVSTVLYRYLGEIMSDEAAVTPQNCFVVDVFAGKVVHATKTYKRNMQHVRAACNEIATLWLAA
jgi:hypothetical protein